MKIQIALLSLCAAAWAQSPMQRQSAANGISITATAGTGGVTAKLLAAKDAANPTTYVLPASGGCGSGIAATTVSAAATFELYVVPGLSLTGVADNTVTAGHILVGGTTTPGRVSDSGQTSRTQIAAGTCIVGVAQASASTAADVTFRYEGPGTYGTLVTRGIGMHFDGGGSALSGTQTKCVRVPFAGTIVGWHIDGGPAGSATFGVKTIAFTSYTGPSGYGAYTDMTGGGTAPSVTTAGNATFANLTSWTTSFAAGLEWCFQLTSPSTFTEVNVTLDVN